MTISGTTITVRKTDGSTTQYTKTGTFTAGADILTGLDRTCDTPTPTVLNAGSAPTR